MKITFINGVHLNNIKNV